MIRAAFQDSDPARLDTLRGAAAEAAEAAAAIPRGVRHARRLGTGPDFDDLVKLLKEIARIIERYGVTAGGRGR